MKRFLLSCLILLSTSLLGDERIFSYHSDIRINHDSSIQVEEQIRVQAEGNQIKRGIYRDFPTRYVDRFGNTVEIEFTVQGVTKDGVAEPYRVERRSNGVRVYVGRSNRFLNPGIYSYSIRYTTNRQLGYFDDYDEFYWNVTGTGWVFPIDKASASVSLPSEIPDGSIQQVAYTGVQGSREQAYRSAVTPGPTAYFEATRTLNAHEGLTIAVSFPKGIVHEPDLFERIGFLLKDNRSLLIALTGFLLLLGYYLYAWNRVGRDPEEGVIIPLYEPEAGYSPASMRYILRMGYDHKTFASAVVNLAVKGALNILEYDKTFTLNRLKGEIKQPLAPGEQALLDALFEDGETIKLEHKNHKRMREALKAHKDSLKADYQKRYFKMNSIYLLPGVISSFIIIALSVGTADRPSFSMFVLFALLMSIHVVFFRLMKAPTMHGRKYMDKFEGFKHYLEMAEKDELNLKHPPERTPETFEYYLPYAMAFDVEQDWAEKFAAMFRNLEDEGRRTKPHWYHGSHWHPSRMGSFASNVGKSFSTAIASSSTPPGSSSGSGGGGFSGGGGGGGGGGGW